MELRLTPISNVGKPNVWVLLNDCVGDSHQMIALAKALNWRYECKNIIHHPKWLYLKKRAVNKLLANDLAPPWPDVLITAGGRNESVALAIKNKSNGKTRLVQLGRTFSSLEEWDLIITTLQYFLPEKSNILHNTLPLYHVNQALLDGEAAKWRHHFSHLPRPFTCVLLGGGTFGFPYTPKRAKHLAMILNQRVEKHGGSILLSTSKRTSSLFSAELTKHLYVPYYAYYWSEDKSKNLYSAYLALADEMIVMGDSISMLAEVCGIGKSLYIYYRSNTRWSYDLKDSIHRLFFYLISRLVPLKNRYDYTKTHQYLVARGQAMMLARADDHYHFDAQPEDDSSLNRAVKCVKKLVGSE